MGRIRLFDPQPAPDRQIVVEYMARENCYRSSLIMDEMREREMILERERWIDEDFEGVSSDSDDLNISAMRMDCDMDCGDDMISQPQMMPLLGGHEVLDEDRTEYISEVGITVELIHSLQVARLPFEEFPEMHIDIPIATWFRLYPHQRAGVAWLWRQAKQITSDKPAGGILGDEMGLGKTIQMLVFLEAVLRSNFGPATALLIVPPTVIASWLDHKETWCPRLRIIALSADTQPAVRANIVQSFKDPTTPSVLLTSFGMLQSLHKRDQLLQQIDWGYCILDEGHLIKNHSSQTAKAARAIPSGIRYIMTGTPVQNSLDELWSLFSFIDPRILGNSQIAFKRGYSDPIRKGMLRTASESAKHLSHQRSEKLRGLCAPYMLQRRQDVIEDILGGSSKIDVVVWCKLSELQKGVYRSYLEGEDVKECILKKQMTGAVCMLTNLKKLCNHLWLQYGREELHSRLAYNNSEAFVGRLIDDCSKMRALIRIYQMAQKDGERILIFSQSVKMLDIISTVLRNVFGDIQLLRLDGGTKQKDRQARVDRFNTDTTIDAMLLTTGVGGVGLTLTGASRVVMFDPDWNPAKDSQAIGRAHRIGQKKQVIVYRLMTCGGVEEFTYRQEIFKECVERKTSRSNTSILRYFSPVELHAMFNFTPDEATTLSQLSTLQGDIRYPDNVRESFNQINAVEGVHGITNHDAVFQVTDPLDEVDTPVQPLPFQEIPLSQNNNSNNINNNSGPVTTPQMTKYRSQHLQMGGEYLPSQDSLSPESCRAGSGPRDEDDKEMLRAAEAFSSRLTMSNVTPARTSLGLPPRHSSKSPSLGRCSNCDFGGFPFCPVTGRAHRKTPEGDDIAGGATNHWNGYSPPLQPQRIQAQLLALAPDGRTLSGELFAEPPPPPFPHPFSIDDHNTDCEMRERSDSAPGAPMREQREVAFSFGSAQRELSFGGSSGSNSTCMGVGLPMRESQITTHTTTTHWVQRELSVGSVCSAPGAPAREHRGGERISFGSVGSALRELSFGSSVCSAPGAPLKERGDCCRAFSIGSAQRELRMSFGSSITAGSNEITTSPAPLPPKRNQRELSFESKSEGHFSFLSCQSSPSQFRNETPQGYSTSHMAPPNAPLRGGSPFDCLMLPMSPVTRIGGIRRRQRDPRSFSASSELEDFQPPTRSISGSTEDSLRMYVLFLVY